MNTISTKQIMADYGTMRNSVKTGDLVEDISMGEVEIDDFFARVDDDPTTRDSVSGTIKSEKNLDLVSYKELSTDTMEFSYVSTVINDPMAISQRNVTFNTHTLEILSNKGNANLDVTA